MMPRSDAVIVRLGRTGSQVIVDGMDISNHCTVASVHRDKYGSITATVELCGVQVLPPLESKYCHLPVDHPDNSGYPDANGQCSVADHHTVTEAECADSDESGILRQRDTSIGCVWVAWCSRPSCLWYPLPFNSSERARSALRDHRNGDTHA
jgi:hypothetical protein